MTPAFFLACSFNPLTAMTDASFWNDLYQTGETRWDIGMPSPPLTAYLDQLTDKNLRILVPGAGYAHEVRHLLEQGFTRVTVIDIATSPIAQLKESTKAYGEAVRLLEEDFFDHQGNYDLILEQAFFCTLEPAYREVYVRQCWNLLAPHGKLAGVLFNREFNPPGPPYGGDQAAYRHIFAPYFELLHWAACKNSFPARQGSEWFMLLQKKPTIAIKRGPYAG
jgi:SAM-dependent methyltransferase